MLAFATGNRDLQPLADDSVASEPVALRAVPAAGLDALFYAVVEATEEAIANALVAGRTMTGRDGCTAHGIPLDRLAALVANAP
jgi:D-aminopeptidase